MDNAIKMNLLARYSKQRVKNFIPHYNFCDIKRSCNFLVILLLYRLLPVTSAFIHPGLLHTQTDFDRMAQKVAANASPWIDDWDVLINNNHSQLSYIPNPLPILHRGVGCAIENYDTLYNDVAAAYQLALRWKISGNTAYADKSVQIMDAWSGTLQEISCPNGTSIDFILLAGIQGFQFANVAEIMRTYPGWDANNFTRFQNMMRNIFFPVNFGSLIHNENFATIPDALSINANWDLASIASVLAIGVLTDNQTMCDFAIDWFKTGRSNGALPQTIYYLHPGHLGQLQESGRDQTHSMLDIEHLGVIAEMAWNQGVDLYGYANNIILAGVEYVAKGNLIKTGTTYYSVPYAAYKYTIHDNTILIVYNGYSNIGIGALRTCWASFYNHYVHRKGLAAPYTEKAMKILGPEGGEGDYGPKSGGYDSLGFGTLTFTLDNPVPEAVPSGLIAQFTGGQVVLSWWGVANASSYNVKRYVGPSPLNTTLYQLIAMSITDLLVYVDVNLGPNTYYYVVTAETSSGESTPSNIATVIADPLKLNTWLKFNESSGNISYDSSGNGHNGYLLGNAKFFPGRIQGGNALSLDGNHSYVSIPDRIIDNLSDFTIATWIYLNEQKMGARLFDFGFGVIRWMTFIPQNGTGNPAFGITVNDRFGAWSVVAQNDLPIKQWVHVATSLFGRSATFYVNGQLLVVAGTSALMAQNYLGRSQYSEDNYLNGLIGDFRIYQGALTVDQIANLINNQGSKSVSTSVLTLIMCFTVFIFISQL